MARDVDCAAVGPVVQAAKPVARGFACSGALAPDEIAATAADAERLGYSSLWMTVLRDVSRPVDMLAAALDSTATIEIGLGLVPLDAFDPAQLATQVAQVPRRVIVTLGVGLRRAGAADFWAAGAATFRRHAPGVRLGVGGYGPEVLRAGGAYADAALLNWTTPDRVRWAARQIGAGARAAGRPTVPSPIYVYVPTASGGDAATELDRARLAMASHDYHRKHQIALGPHPSLGLALPANAGRVAVPTYGRETVSVINPTGPSTRESRRALLQACAPLGTDRR